MKSYRRSVMILLILFLLANLLYFVKAVCGVDFLPGHHGGLFPIGDWLWRITHRSATE